LLVTTITLSELLHGAHRAEADDLRDKRFRFAAMMERDYCMLPFGVRKARNHAALTTEMQQLGISSGAHDMLIGAIARCHGHSVSTLNVAEFARMPGILVMDASPFRITRSAHP
jgi:tRNA(fMet)-specific endonuclease VapC